MKVQNNFADKFHFWFNLIMMFVYALVGVLLIFVIRFDSLPVLNTKMMGGVLLLYATYRGYKLFKTNAVRTDSDQAHANQ